MVCLRPEAAAQVLMNKRWRGKCASCSTPSGELALLASMVKLAILRDDFRDVGFELCDMSAPALGKDRRPTTYTLDSFRILSEA